MTESTYQKVLNSDLMKMMYNNEGMWLYVKNVKFIRQTSEQKKKSNDLMMVSFDKKSGNLIVRV